MAGTLVDAHHRLLRGSGCQAEDAPHLRIEPRPLEVHALIRLDREVAAVRLIELLAVTPMKPVWTSMNLAIPDPP